MLCRYNTELLTHGYGAENISAASAAGGRPAKPATDPPSGILDSLPSTLHLRCYEVLSPSAQALPVRQCPANFQFLGLIAEGAFPKQNACLS